MAIGSSAGTSQAECAYQQSWCAPMVPPWLHEQPSSDPLPQRRIDTRSDGTRPVASDQTNWQGGGLKGASRELAGPTGAISSRPTKGQPVEWYRGPPEGA